MRSRLTVVVLVALCVTGLAPSAWADWMSAYSGYSAFEDPINGNTDGYVSFAVWDRGSPSGDLPTLPTGAEYMVWTGSTFESGTPTGQYIYFYQVVNAQNGNSEISWFGINWAGFLNVGYVVLLSGNQEVPVVFKDAQTPVGSSSESNWALDGTSSSPPLGDDAIGGGPTMRYVIPEALTELSGAVLPSGMHIKSTADSFTKWSFLENDIENYKTSVLLFGTSDHAPGFIRGFAIDGGAAGDCDVPAPIPEPGSLAALAGLAMTTAGLGILRRRRTRG